MNAVAKFEQAIAALGRLLSDRPGLAKRVGTFDLNIARAAIDEFIEIDARITALEKQVAAGHEARLEQIERDLGALRSQESTSGLAKTIGRGVDPWRQ
jgi:hypothetical protein